MNTAERMLPHFVKAINVKDVPLVVPHAFRERRDIAAATISEAYAQMLEEPMFGETERHFLNPKTKITLFSLPAAAPHTGITLKARKIDGRHMAFANSPNLEGDEFDVPAQQFHWMISEDTSGDKLEYTPISYSELAAFPTWKRRKILSAYAQRLINGKRELDAALLAQNIPDADRGSYIYATIGHHHKVRREVDGFGRGPQSNPTVHHSITFFPPNEHIKGNRRIEDMSPDELVKAIDPLSSIFFEATSQPIRSIMENVVTDFDVNATVDVIPEHTDHEEPFPFGWKVNFKEDIPLEKGMDMFIHFVSQMKLLWDDGRELGEDTQNKDKQRKVAQVTGEEGVDIFSSWMRPTLERIEEETRNIATLLLGQEERADLIKEIYKFLIVDYLANHPRFTMPGDASFNVLYDVDTKTGNVRSISFTPALNEKGIAERITGAHYDREAKLA